MSKKQGTSKGLVVVGAVLFLVPFWVLRRMDLPGWGTALWLGAVTGCVPAVRPVGPSRAPP